MKNQLELLIRSGNPFLSVETADEDRALGLIMEVARELGRPIFEWSMTGGIIELSDYQRESTYALSKPEHERKTVLSASSVLKQILESKRTAIYVFRDLGPHAKDAHVHRLLRDCLKDCERTNSTFVFVDALPLPDELKRFTIPFEIPWPTEDELQEVVKDTFRKVRDEAKRRVSSKITKREMEQLVMTLRGLTCGEASRVVASAILNDHQLSAADLPHIIEAKRTLLQTSGCLEAIAADFEPEDIGGLENLKSWLKKRCGGFSPRAKDFGLEPPRGVLMLGVPGCGKSLCAKVVAADWKMPLLRLDPGVLYQKFIGESESQLRQALRQAESMAPVILWIDEIEKAFASASASSADGGLSKRMFGTLLSWMQDHRHPIFIVATANDISALPPELMRKGRFDEVFFVDLPDQSARGMIFEIHLRRRNRNPDDFNLPKLAELTADFSGSEIEQLVISALFLAFNRNEQLQDTHFLEEIPHTRPLARLTHEKVTELRSWAQNRCVPAH